MILAFLAFFIMPLGASAAWWSTVDRPQNWREADWSSTGLLPPAEEQTEAVVHVMAARTGGLKGAFSVHSWIVTKAEGSPSYTRYDKVGWGRPVRENAYAADARWYSNPPFIIKTITGDAAQRLIPAIEKAVATYPHQDRGDYRIWPGPNSNSFVAHVLRAVPAVDATLPPNAVGKDWIAGGDFTHLDASTFDGEISLYGLAGLAVGARSGLEVHLFGQTFGIDVLRPALKLPGIGRVGFSR